MRLFLDDREHPLDRPSLAEALRVARDAAEAQGRIIVDASLDGQPLSPMLLERPPEDTRQSGELRLVTAEPFALVYTTLQEVGDALETTHPEQLKAAELIQVGKLEEGLEMLSSSLAVWDQVRQAVEHGAALVGLDLQRVYVSDHPLGDTDGDPAPGESSVAQHATTLANSLTEVKRSMNAQDWSGLADAVAYDLAERSKEWTLVTRAVAAAVRIRRDAAPSPVNRKAKP